MSNMTTDPKKLAAWVRQTAAAAGVPDVDNYDPVAAAAALGVEIHKQSGEAFKFIVVDGNVKTVFTPSEWKCDKWAAAEALYRILAGHLKSAPNGSLDVFHGFEYPHPFNELRWGEAARQFARDLLLPEKRFHALDAKWRLSLAKQVVKSIEDGVVPVTAVNWLLTAPVERYDHVAKTCGLLPFFVACRGRDLGCWTRNL